MASPSVAPDQKSKRLECDKIQKWFSLNTLFILWTEVPVTFFSISIAKENAHR